MSTILKMANSKNIIEFIGEFERIEQSSKNPVYLWYNIQVDRDENGNKILNKESICSRKNQGKSNEAKACPYNYLNHKCEYSRQGGYPYENGRYGNDDYNTMFIMLNHLPLGDFVPIVFDVDNKDSNDSMLMKFCMAKFPYVETNKGYHIYAKFEYGSFPHEILDKHTHNVSLLEPGYEKIEIKTNNINETKTRIVHNCDSNTSIDWYSFAEYFFIDFEHTKEAKIEEYSFMSVDTKKQLEIVIMMLDKLDRKLEYHDWFRVGILSKNTLKVPKSVWLEFNKKQLNSKGEPRDSRFASTTWNNIPESYENVGIGTLLYLLKKSCPAFYDFVKSCFIKKSVENIKDDLIRRVITHDDASQLFYDQFKGKYCYSTDSQKWYLLNEYGLLVILNDPKTQLGKEIRIFLKELIADIIKYSDDEIEKLSKSLGQLSTNKFMKETVEDIQKQYMINKFEEKIDTNSYLLGFQNGVYDLEKHIFRNGTIEDMIQKKCGIDFKEEFDQEKFDWLENLIISNFDQDDGVYFLKFLGSSLEMTNFDELCHFFVGVGRNSKGTICDLWKYILGDYWCTFDKDFYVNPKKASGGNPEFLKLQNTRVCMTAEIEADEKFKSATFKNITGGDEFTERALYSNTIIKFIFKGKTALQCNHKPKYESIDSGLLSRIRVLNFPRIYKHPDEYDKTNPNHREIIPNLKNMLQNEYANEFMHILLKYYKLYKKEGLKPTANISAYTQEYKQDLDEMQSFLDDTIKQTGDKKDNKIKVGDLMDMYKEYYDKDKCQNQWFSKELEKRNIQMKKMTSGKMLIGYVLKESVKSNQCEIESDNDDL